MIPTRPSTEQIMREAPADHIGMVHDGIAKVLQGITTIEEIFRVAKTIGEDD
jgi:type II secretory ATPase GspE/PulE/Tfp pilus assembly ATPase PilB-like protein